jgi:HKD family nuclease
VKLHLRHTLHAKLYLLFRHDPVSPSIGFLGSSNLTSAGLSKQRELNVDIVHSRGDVGRWPAEHIGR